MKKLFGCANQQFHQLSGGQVSEDPAGEEAGCGGPGLTWSDVLRPVGRTAKLFKRMLEVAYGREINIEFSGNSFGGHSRSQHVNYTLPQNLRYLCHCVV